MIYLNNASTSYPKPQVVLDAVQRYCQSMPVSPGRGFCTSEFSQLFECGQSLVSTLISAPTSNDVFFFQNATCALNQAIFGLNWAPGDEIVTTVTEHNSVLRPVHYLQQHGVRVRFVACDIKGQVEAEAILANVTEKTRLVIVNHVSNVTGAVQDLPRIGALLREYRALFLVDASQSLGIYPVDVEQSRIDLLAFTGHKFLYGLQGIGGLYIRNGVKLKPFILGGTGVLSEQLEQPEQNPWRYQAGTVNMVGIASLCAGIEYLQTMPALLQTLRHKTDRLKCVIEAEGGRCHAAKGSTIISFSFGPSFDSSEIEQVFYESFGIVVRAGLHCAPMLANYIDAPSGTVRISPSASTSDADIASACEAIKVIAASGLV